MSISAGKVCVFAPSEEKLEQQEAPECVCRFANEKLQNENIVKRKIA